MSTAPDYLLLDAARMKRNFDLFREKDCHFDCLYEDRSRDDLGGVAPYLVTVTADKDLLPWFKENGLGDAWGICFVASAGFETLLQHFRKFVVTKTAGGGEQYFRFYDPRVLKRFLPAAAPQDVISFFGPVDAFITEGSTKEKLIVFTHQGGKLQQEDQLVSEWSFV